MTQQSNNVTQMTDPSADRSLLSPLQLRLPFTFSNSEHFSYANFQVLRPDKIIMSNDIVYTVIRRPCGENCTGSYTRISSHWDALFLKMMAGMNIMLKNCEQEF